MNKNLQRKLIVSSVYRACFATRGKLEKSLSEKILLIIFLIVAACDYTELIESYVFYYSTTIGPKCLMLNRFHPVANFIQQAAVQTQPLLCPTGNLENL